MRARVSGQLAALDVETHVTCASSLKIMNLILTQQGGAGGLVTLEIN